VVALTAAAVAVGTARLLFPHLSIDNDEPLYLLQAQALADGHLFPPAPEPAGSYRPWLAVTDGDRYVLKYTPVVPGLLAASLRLTGSVLPALALVAAAGVGFSWLLARELYGSPRVAAVAAALFAGSPLVVVHSGLLLPYLPTVVLLQAGAWGLIRGVRQDRRTPLAVAGLALGLAFASRAYDTVLVALPLLGWAAAVWVRRGRVPARAGRPAARSVLVGAVVGGGGRESDDPPSGAAAAPPEPGPRPGGLRWRRRLGWFLLPASAPLLALAVFNVAATGSPLRLPFALLEPDDAVGFGRRRLYPSDGGHRFGLVEGLSGVGDHLLLLGIGWLAGGALLAGLVVLAAARGRVRGPAAALALTALTVPVGYLFFWGAWNAADLWGGIRYVGPFYLLPVVVPLSVVGAAELVRLAAGRPRLAAGAAAVACAAAVAVLVGATTANATFTRHDGALLRAVEAQGTRPLVFLCVDPPFLAHPASALATPPDPGGRVVYAVGRGADDLRVLADHPGRTPYLLTFSGQWHRQRGDAGASARLQPLTRVTEKAVRLRLTLTPPPDAARITLEVAAGGRRLTYRLDPTGATGAQLEVRPGGADLPDRRPDEVRPGGPDGTVEIVLRVAGDGGRDRDAGRLRLAAVPTGSRVGMLVPGRELTAVGPASVPALRVTAVDPA
jgi:hypothetical protein